MTSVPQVHLADRVANLRLGNVVGGSSTVNGMGWDRGSAVDYDSWEELGNDGWGWESLLKYFRKSSRFSPPAEEYVGRYGYEWSADSYGEGPINVGFPSWQWPAAGKFALIPKNKAISKLLGGCPLDGCALYYAETLQLLKYRPRSTPGSGMDGRFEGARLERRCRR